MDPTSNKFGEGSSLITPSTVFQSTIYPDKNEVEIPPDFLQNWKDKICRISRGFVKDPANNTFIIDTAHTRKDNCLHMGKKVSTYCGFSKPQSVIFDYEFHYNDFKMRFVDEDGNEILYLGIHHPINYHQTKLDNPDCYILPGIFYEGEKPDYLPIQYGLVSDEHGIEIIQIVEQSASHYTWEQCVSQNFADGKGALNFPAVVCKDEPFRPDQDIVVINIDTNQSVVCTVNKSSKVRRRHPEYNIGGNFYKFVKGLGLKPNDKLIFGLDNPPTRLHFMKLEESP